MILSLTDTIGHQSPFACNCYIVDSTPTMNTMLADDGYSNGSAGTNAHACADATTDTNIPAAGESFSSYGKQTSTVTCDNSISDSNIASENNASIDIGVDASTADATTITCRPHCLQQLRVPSFSRTA